MPSGCRAVELTFLRPPSGGHDPITSKRLVRDFQHSVPLLDRFWRAVENTPGGGGGGAVPLFLAARATARLTQPGGGIGGHKGHAWRQLEYADRTRQVVCLRMQ
jgi:hypothetical protein